MLLDITPEEEKKFAIGAFARWASFIARFISFPLVDIFYKIINRSRAIGVENIPKDGGVIFASNHVSGVDTTLIPAFAASRVRPVPFVVAAKEELFRIPVVAQLIRAWGAFPVKRRQRDTESMKRIAFCARHYQLMLFPEGTRSKTGELLEGRPAVGWVVYNSRPKVIPTLVINTDKFFWPGRPRPWFGVPYTVVFGEPVDMDRFYEMPESKETSRLIAGEIMKAIAALREKHKDLYVGPLLLPDGSIAPAQIGTGR
ncbi:MAG: 1-acyl-sn-glycerol-3-phosphate acyltransferase [Nitrospinae bacterium]|nr:1-acyl-sn-glycerol-3-phosphate acyltransferase [Nitrospinota bacterium]